MINNPATKCILQNWDHFLKHHYNLPMSKFDRWNGETWQPSITDAKAAKIQQIKAHCDTVTADYIIIDGNHFHSDANSRIQQMSLTRMGQAKQIPAGLMWQTKITV